MGERITVNIHGSGSELQGVARLTDGRAVFIPFALPGETVEAEITVSKERFAEARLIKVVTPSQERVAPDCPAYYRCGGCRARHMTYECALKLKREKVYNAITRIGGVKDAVVEDTLPSPLTAGYRNKAEFACGDGRAGVFQEGSRQVIDVDECLLQSEGANALLKYLKGEKSVKYIVPRTNSQGEVMLTLSCLYPAELEETARRVMRDMPFVKSVYRCVLNCPFEHALDGECRLLAGEKTIREQLCGLTFEVSPRSFFQVNRLQCERLYGKALEFAGLTGFEHVCDIYCGAGTISLCAARQCEKVTGIEIVPDAIKDAKRNAQANGLSDKTEFLCGNAAKLYPQISKRFDCVIVDPPRKGLDKPVTEALIAKPAQKLVYVSCDPGTLARDIKLLTASGAYEFIKAVPVDMFPGTAHIETVCLLSRN